MHTIAVICFIVSLTAFGFIMAGAIQKDMKNKELAQGCTIMGGIPVKVYPYDSNVICVDKNVIIKP